MAFIDGTVVNVALPALQASFHATVVDVQWVVESYGLFLGALILVGGSLGDLFGRRRMFVLGVIVFTAASIACGLAHNVHQLVIARSIQGIGAAFLVPGSLAIIGAAFEENTRGRAIGTWSGFTSITTALGPVLGGWLIEHASWRWAFFLNLPLAVAVIAISLWKVPESRGSSAGRIDWRGALLVTVGLAGLVNGLIESVDLGWRHPLVFGSLDGWRYWSDCLLSGRSPSKLSNGSLEIIRFPKLQRRELLTLFLYAALSIFFFVFPDEPDSSAGIFRYRSRGGNPPTDFAAVRSFPLVGRIGGPLWPANSASGRTVIGSPSGSRCSHCHRREEVTGRHSSPPWSYWELEWRSRLPR